MAGSVTGARRHRARIKHYRYMCPHINTGGLPELGGALREEQPVEREEKQVLENPCKEDCYRYTSHAHGVEWPVRVAPETDRHVELLHERGRHAHRKYYFGERTKVTAEQL